MAYSAAYVLQVIQHTIEHAACSVITVYVGKHREKAEIHTMLLH